MFCNDINEIKTLYDLMALAYILLMPYKLNDVNKYNPADYQEVFDTIGRF